MGKRQKVEGKRIINRIVILSLYFCNKLLQAGVICQQITLHCSFVGNHLWDISQIARQAKAISKQLIYGILRNRFTKHQGKRKKTSPGTMAIEVTQLSQATFYDEGQVCRPCVTW